MDNAHNVDQSEISKFEELASRWWDPHGEFQPLHEINPLRLDWIDQHAGLAGKRVLDVGCGGGILSESMAARGAQVTGIDMGEAPLEVARLHLLESGLEVLYERIPVERLAAEHPAAFDIVTCMELLEHMPDPASAVAACAALVRPGGWVFFATINRNPRSYLFAILGAEYLLGLLPRGTHDFAKFIRPRELLGWIDAAELSAQEMTGLTYNPLTRRYRLGRDVQVNYMICCRRDVDA